MTLALTLFLAAYLIGAIPFGYVIGRLRGVDLFQVGSGNIGATNAGRVLGWPMGAIVFALDFLKGALPVLLAVPAARLWNPDVADSLQPPELLRVGSAACAFLGHLFPVYLGCRGGKGVATGAGAVIVLVPLPAAIALGTWLLVLLATRTVSLASIAAVLTLTFVRLVFRLDPFSETNWLVSAFCIAGSIVVLVKHRANVVRLRSGTENRIADGSRRRLILRMLHLLAVGFWFGSGTFFVFVATAPIFDSFSEVVKTQPNTRTAGVRIVPEETSEAKRNQLASALAGAAVGPIFPRFFALSAVAAWIALWTAIASNGRGIHRWRLTLCILAAVGVALGWPLSIHVSELRELRFSTDASVASAAATAFGPWHVASLLLSMVVCVLTGIILLLAAKLPAED